MLFRSIKSRRLRWAGHVARMEEGRKAFKILTGQKRPLGMPRRRWEEKDNGIRIMVKFYAVTIFFIGSQFVVRVTIVLRGLTDCISYINHNSEEDITEIEPSIS